MNACVLTAAKANLLQIQTVAGSVLWRYGTRTNLNEYLRTFALPGGSSRTQDDMVLKSLQRNFSHDVAIAFADFMRELYWEQDGSVQHSEISMTFIGSGWISGFNGATLDAFTEVQTE